MSVAFEPRMTAVQFELCKVQAELFETACAKNYDMSAFVPAFMSSEIAEGLDARFNHYQWAGVPYLLNAMGDICGVVPAKHPPMRDSAEACYWTGYTYRFWNFKTGEASRDIYRMADYRTMDRAYAGYHTLSCDMAVDWLREGKECLVRSASLDLWLSDAEVRQLVPSRQRRHPL